MRYRRNNGKSIQACNILYFSHRSRYDGKNTESCLQLGKPPQEYVGMVRQMVNICPSLPMHTCLMGLPSMLFSARWQTVSYSDKSVFTLSHNSESSASPQSRKAEFQPNICCSCRELPLFPVLSRSFRLGRQRYGHMIMALQVFRKKSPRPFRGSIFHEKLV